MAYGGRLVKPEIAGAMLLAASSDLASGGPVPGLGGHAVLYGPFVLLVGLDLQEPHLDPHFIDSDYIPQVTAREVVDRASLKVFVNEAIQHVGQLIETHGFDAANIVRGAFRDRNGPWISGPAYLFIFDPVHGYAIFHGAFPDRYEYRVAGANRDHYHLRHVTPGRDFETSFDDLRDVAEGDACAQCGKPVTLRKYIEVGHIFELNRRYSESMGLSVLDSNDKEVTPIMGSYGIGLERILATSVEQNHDDAGMVLPASIAPFDHHVELACRPYYKSTLGRPSIPPGVYFRLLLLGYLIGVDSERALAFYARDSLNVRRFLGYALHEPVPACSTFARTRRRISLNTQQEVLGWVLQHLRERGLESRPAAGVARTTSPTTLSNRTQSASGYRKFVESLAEHAHRDAAADELQ